MEDVRSKHFADSANWIQKVIESGTHPLHDNVSRKLIQLWETKWNFKIHTEDYSYLSKRMRDALDAKFYEKIEKLKKGENTIS